LSSNKGGGASTQPTKFKSSKHADPDQAKLEREKELMKAESVGDAVKQIGKPMI